MEIRLAGVGGSTKVNGSRDLGLGWCFPKSWSACHWCLVKWVRWHVGIFLHGSYIYGCVCMATWSRISNSILSMGFLYTPTPFKASGLLMSKSGIVLPSCSFYPSAGRQIDTYSHLLDSDIAKSASLFKQTSLFFFCLWSQESHTHTPRGDTLWHLCERELHSV